MISVRVPAMRSRQCVRAISARVSDVPGVHALKVDVLTRTLQVSGPADPSQIVAAIAAAGYAAEKSHAAEESHAVESSRPATPWADAFPTDPAGLPEALGPAVLELGDGAELDLRLGPVAKRLGGSTVRMLGYNGSIPGPTLVVREGSEVTVRVANDGDLETTVHWHGLRLENQYDGVPHETQLPIPVGDSFTYRIQFPDPGLYWYHPHIREDYGQEMGLYGNILVTPSEPHYWPPAHRDVVLTLDDVLIEEGRIAPFSPAETSFTAMGRFGNVLLVSGDSALRLSVQVGEVVRLWLTNTANTRVFNVALPGARLKLVGGDSGRMEREEFVSHLVLAPSERAVVDVLFERPGELTLEHRTPDRDYPLASITVAGKSVTPSLQAAYDLLREAPELAVQRQQLGAWLAAPPDKTLALIASMDMSQEGAPVMSHGASHEHGVAEEHGAPDEHGTIHEHGGAGDDADADGIEWEDHMVEVNRQTTTANMVWSLVDRTTGGDRPPVDWRFAVGDRVKIRLVNEMESDHPMHHPFHMHGAGRFLVLARDGIPEPNLVWKDSVLIRTGQTVDILFDVTNPGLWMAHCHIPEHMASGMAFSFTVDRKPSA